MMVKLIKVAVLAIVFGMSVESIAQNNNDKPNFLFILVEELGYMDVGFNNPHTFYETPNIDTFAKKGVRFTKAYAASPVCSPTRASILTGKSLAHNNTGHFGAPQPYEFKRVNKDILVST